MSEKPTNPKDAIGSNKLPLHLWPMSATAFGCIGLANGMLKYGRSNWREAGVRPSIYVDAAIRHLTDWFEGGEEDPDDGVHNLAGAIACVAILIDAKMKLPLGNPSAERDLLQSLDRVESALRQNPEFKVIYEFPDAKSAKVILIISS